MTPSNTAAVSVPRAASAVSRRYVPLRLPTVTSPLSRITAEFEMSELDAAPQFETGTSITMASRSPLSTSAGGVSCTRFRPACALNGPRSATSVKLPNAVEDDGRRNFTLYADEHEPPPHI